MTELCTYQTTNIELKNELMIEVFCANLTYVRERRTHEEIKDRGYYIVFSWENGNSLLEESNIRGH